MNTNDHACWHCGYHVHAPNCAPIDLYRRMGFTDEENALVHVVPGDPFDTVHLPLSYWDRHAISWRNESFIFPIKVAP